MSNGLDFERQVHALLKNMGFEAEITKASGDGGIDIIAHSKEHITGGKYIIQCKDWSKPVGEPPVRDLFGVVTAESANKGILITTSTFTAPAINFAAGKPLELIDGAKFSQLLAKYSLGGIQNTATDDERIKVLTEQLNKNPKNILVLKELADTYLMQGLYDEASELYEKMRDLKPSVETERLKDAYWGGLNNYGVALAMNKKYDEALILFKKMQPLFAPLSYLTTNNEAELLMYLGLYDIASAVLQHMKSNFNQTPESLKILEEQIELAYIEEQPEFSFLFMKIDAANPEFVELESARKKAWQEAKIEIAKSFYDVYSNIYNEFLNYWEDLASKIENDLYFSQSEDELRADIFKHVELTNKTSTEVVSVYSPLVDMFSTESTLQELHRQSILIGIERLELIQAALKKFSDDMNNSQNNESWIEVKSILLASMNDSTSKISENQQREKAIINRCNEELKKAEEHWAVIIDQDKAEWRAKIRGIIYQQTSSNMTADELTGHMAHMKEKLKLKWQTGN